LAQVPHPKLGDKVRVIDSLETAKQLQVDHGGWVDSMQEVLLQIFFCNIKADHMLHLIVDLTCFYYYFIVFAIFCVLLLYVYVFDLYY